MVERILSAVEGQPTAAILGELVYDYGQHPRFWKYRLIGVWLFGRRRVCHLLVLHSPRKLQLGDLISGSAAVLDFEWHDDENERQMQLGGVAQTIIAQGFASGYGFDWIESADRRTLRVGYVWPGSVAARTRMRKGDVIIRIDKEVSDRLLDLLMAATRDRRSTRLTLKRGSRSRYVELSWSSYVRRR